MKNSARKSFARTTAVALIAAILVLVSACGNDTSKGTRDDPFPYEKSRSGFGWG